MVFHFFHGDIFHGFFVGLDRIPGAEKELIFDLPTRGIRHQ
jgi:hypothetical protein